jgi:hypothetical protein
MTLGIQISSAPGSGALPLVFRALDGQVPDPASVGVHEPTLDDVFLGLTGLAHPSPAEPEVISGRC